MIPATNFFGLASGLDTASLIDAMIAIERRPILVLQNRQLDKTNELTAWKSVEAMMLGLQTQASILNRPSTFSGAFSAISSHESILTATASESAASGTYTLSVNQLAQSHQLASAGYKDPSTVHFGTGDLQISVGGTTHVIEIDSGEDTLEGIRNAINDAGIPVSASVIDTGSGDYGHQLVLTGSKTGAENAISVTSSLSDGTDDLSFNEAGAIGVPTTWAMGSTALPSFGGSYWGIDDRTYSFTVLSLGAATVGSAVLDTWLQADATPTAGGTYTGTGDKTFTFTATSSGVVGTDALSIDWDDGLGGSGTINLDATYAGEAVAIAEGVTIGFDVGGSVTTGRDFHVDVSDSATIGSGSNDIHVAYDDGIGHSGTLQLNSTYTPGNELDLGDGMTVAFAAGDVTQGDTFDLDVTAGTESNTIQAAQDAEVLFGSSTGGGNPITVHSATNVLDSLIEGVSLNLLDADPGESVTVTVDRDDASITSSVQSFVNSYNSLMSFLNDQFSYDSDLEAGGTLLGDSNLLMLQTRVRSMVTGIQPDLPKEMRMLSQVGIRSTTTGTLTFDSTIFEEKLSEDFEGVNALFSEVGEATDNNVTYVSSTEDTVARGVGYHIEVTRAATHAEQTGDYVQISNDTPLVIDVAHKKMEFAVDGRSSGVFNIEEGSYTSGEELATMINNAISEQTTLDGNEIAVTWEAHPTDSEQGRLVVASASYGSESTVEVLAPPSSANLEVGLRALGVSSGIDVQGRIDGIAAEGSGRVLTGITGDAKGLAVEIDLTPEELIVQGADQGRVSFTRGAGFYLNEAITGYASETGLVGGRIGSLQTQIDTLADQIESMEERIAIRQQALFQEFVSLEVTMGALQAESSFLTSQLSSLQNLNNNS